MISGSLFFYQNWLTFLLALWLRFLLTKAVGAVYTGLLGMPFDELDTHKNCCVLMMNENLLNRLIDEVSI